MTSKVKINFDANVQPNKSDILQIFNNANVKCSKLVSIVESNQFLAYCATDSDADRVFSSHCITPLSAIRCTPVLPMHLKAKRTVIVRRLDSHVYNNSTDDIRDEINECNDFLEASSVFKFPHSNIIKVTCCNQDMAGACIKNGLRMFHMYVPGVDISCEEYHNVKICFKCYELDSHLTYECTKSRDYVICSTCSELGHSFRACTSSSKCCINCSGSHSTMAYSCPKRKEIIARLKEDKTSSHFVSDNKSAWPSLNPTGPVNWSPINECVSLSMMCIIMASAKDKESPGSFQATLTELQTVNKVPSFKMGNVSPPDFQSLVSAQPSVISAAGGSGVGGASGGGGGGSSAGASSSSQSAAEKSRPFPVITILKKKTTPTITSSNIERLYKEGFLRFDTPEKLSTERCLQLLLGNLMECKVAISKSVTRDFRSLKH